MNPTFFCQNVQLEVRILVHTTNGNLKLEITQEKPDKRFTASNEFTYRFWVHVG